MKFTIAMLSLVLSANVFAFSLVSTAGVSISSEVLPAEKIQATLVLNDAQEMLNNGGVSLFLSQKLQETQDLNDGLSEAEALDILIESAQTILAE